MKRDAQADDGDGDAATSRRAGAGRSRRGSGGGPPTPLERWLERVLDRDGVPRHLPAAAWARLLAVLDQARRDRPEGWPERLDARIEGLLLATLRFARAGGAPVFTPPGARPAGDAPDVFRGWAQQAGRTRSGDGARLVVPSRRGGRASGQGAGRTPAAGLVERRAARWRSSGPTGRVRAISWRSTSACPGARRSSS